LNYFKKHILSYKIYRSLRSIYYLYGTISSILKLNSIKYKWLDLNKHNKTIVGNVIDDIDFPIELVTVGIGTYGPLRVYSYGAENERLIIGNFCSISSGVLFILGGNHKSEIFSTFPFRFFLFDQLESVSKGPIVIEDDVWIGTNSIILSGVTIAQGTIIAAGSVVTKSTEPYSIIGGNPAKLIKKRFNEDIIFELNNFDYSQVDLNLVRNNINDLYKPLDFILIKSLSKKIINK
jgi:acetyltransferase-like isoleucine patch superfamily enzyme